MKNKKIFEAKNISVQTLEGKEILKNISFFINRGEKVLLEGENGIGKSTIMNAIFKNPNHKVSSQYIHFIENDNITNIQDFNTTDIAKIGMFYNLQIVPEIPGLSTIKFLYKAYQNININKENIIGIVDFKNLLLKYCQDFEIDTSLIERDLNVGFSGGEKKQAMLLHLLVLKPKIIFADEPESGVDKYATDKVYKVLNFLVKNGASLFIISHNEKSQTKLKIDRKYILRYNQNVEKVLEEVAL